jgi:hypothetical protein
LAISADVRSVSMIPAGQRMAADQDRILRVPQPLQVLGKSSRIDRDVPRGVVLAQLFQRGAR